MKFNAVRDIAVRRWPRAAIAAAVLIGAALLLNSIGSRPEARGEVGVMTTLPLFWQEGEIDDIVRTSGAPSAAVQRLERNYELNPVDSLDGKTLANTRFLILAQPRGLSPSELTRLDTWLRKGGRLLLFADPALRWESIYPLGDKRRPLFTSLLSPLLTHWGLELVLPVAAGTEDLQVFDLDGGIIRTATPGAWHSLDRGAAGCTVEKPAIVATCKIGAGTAILIADADVLDAVYWRGSGIRSLAGFDDFANLEWTEIQLQKLVAGSGAKNRE
jgi:hypothetical protein